MYPHYQRPSLILYSTGYHKRPLGIRFHFLCHLLLQVDRHTSIYGMCLDSQMIKKNEIIISLHRFRFHFLVIAEQLLSVAVDLKYLEFRKFVIKRYNIQSSSISNIKDVSKVAVYMSIQRDSYF